MNKQIAQKNGDNKQFIVILYEQSIIFEARNIIININVNCSNKGCLYFLENKSLICMKSL